MSQHNKLFILAGEASGDLHGSNLVRSLLNSGGSLDIKGWGGENMLAAGVQILKPIEELSFMGFTEVLLNIRSILRNFNDCKEQINAFKPDAVILIDYPGFNLRMAKWLKRKGYKVIYYISPQIWAWKEKRVELIKKYVDRMLVILPFEKDFYQKHGVEADYVGHPLLEAIANRSVSEGQIDIAIPSNQPLVAILPGSRKQEIKSLLPTMLETAVNFKDTHFAIAAAPGIPEEFYNDIIADRIKNGTSKVSIIKNATYDLLHQADAAMVCSGTATLETALFKVPQVVCYKANTISYAIAKRLVKVKYISLVNLILDKPFLSELIQDDFNSQMLSKELDKCLSPRHHIYFKTNYDELSHVLKAETFASDNAARIIMDVINPV